MPLFSLLARVDAADQQRLVDYEMQLHKECSVPFGLNSVMSSGE